MNARNFGLVLVSAALLVYLTVALLKPEKF